MTTTANVLGVFAHVDTTLQAIRDLRAKGFSNLTVYTPVPVEEIEHEIDKVEPLSKVRLFTVIGALTGTATGFFLTIWSSLKWELVTGGKAPVSIPPFVIIALADDPAGRPRHRAGDPGPGPAPQAQAVVHL
jgi:molybdopterin-containing oxidoreductase family membrane subunit